MLRPPPQRNWHAFGEFHRALRPGDRLSIWEPIILSALVVPADVKDNLPMLDLLWRTCFRWRLRPDHLTDDSTTAACKTQGP